MTTTPTPTVADIERLSADLARLRAELAATEADLNAAAERMPLDPTDGTWTVSAEPLRGTSRVVMSARLHADTAAALIAEARRVDTKPATLLADLAAEALAARAALPADSDVVTVRLADLHRAIDAAAHRRAA